jgi:hypothetical protein
MEKTATCWSCPLNGQAMQDSTAQSCRGLITQTPRFRLPPGRPQIQSASHRLVLPCADMAFPHQDTCLRFVFSGSTDL